MFFGTIIFVIVWSLIALFLRKYPETMAGYNTMPENEREKIDIGKIGRLMSNTMWSGVPFALLAPLMPSPELFTLMVVGIPAGMLVAVAIYVNVCHKKFEK